MPQILANKSDSYARSIFVSENDVYVAGFMRDKGRYIATLWKNGTTQKLTDGYEDAKAHSVFVSNNDVYVAGIEGSDYYRSVAVLWKNGIPQNLTDGNHKAEAHSVFVSGDDVYVVGVGYEYVDE